MLQVQSIILFNFLLLRQKKGRTHLLWTAVCLYLYFACGHSINRILDPPLSQFSVQLSLYSIKYQSLFSQALIGHTTQLLLIFAGLSRFLIISTCVQPKQNTGGGWEIFSLRGQRRHSRRIEVQGRRHLLHTHTHTCIGSIVQKCTEFCVCQYPPIKIGLNRGLSIVLSFRGSMVLDIRVGFVSIKNIWTREKKGDKNIVYSVSLLTLCR